MGIQFMSRIEKNWIKSKCFMDLAAVGLIIAQWRISHTTNGLSLIPKAIKKLYTVSMLVTDINLKRWDAYEKPAGTHG